jgi:hypothetical protein
MGVVPESVEVRSQEDLEKGLANARTRRAAIFVWQGPLPNMHLRAICTFALQNRLPTMMPSTRVVSE